MTETETETETVLLYSNASTKTHLIWHVLCVVLRQINFTRAFFWNIFFWQHCVTSVYLNRHRFIILSQVQAWQSGSNSLSTYGTSKASPRYIVVLMTVVEMDEYTLHVWLGMLHFCNINSLVNSTANNAKYLFWYK